MGRGQVTLAGRPPLSFPEDVVAWLWLYVPKAGELFPARTITSPGAAPWWWGEPALCFQASYPSLFFGPPGFYFEFTSIHFFAPLCLQGRASSLPGKNPVWHEPGHRSRQMGFSPFSEPGPGQAGCLEGKVHQGTLPLCVVSARTESRPRACEAPPAPLSKPARSQA